MLCQVKGVRQLIQDDICTNVEYIETNKSTRQYPIEINHKKFLVK